MKFYRFPYCSVGTDESKFSLPENQGGHRVDKSERWYRCHVTEGRGDGELYENNKKDVDANRNPKGPL
jgi:hypothetical protein